VATSSPKRTTTKKAVFDIEQAEKEFLDSERPEPFTVRMKSGSVVTFADPAALNWQDAAALTRMDPYLFLRTVIVDDDEFKAFTGEAFPQVIIRDLMNAYQDHYALDDDQGN
jgi:hypothetical protein